MCDEGFRQLKHILTTAPILAYPNFEIPFIVTTDASDFALGAVLSQGEIGSDRPVCYASRTMNPAETRYSTIEKELLGIIYAVSQFRPYIYGRKFTLYTDHKPLVWVMSLKDPSSRLVRWRIKLEEYDYTVVYKSGKSNTNADALSRIPFSTINIVQTRSKTVKNSQADLPSPNSKYVNPPNLLTDKSFPSYNKSNINDVIALYRISEKHGQIYRRSYDLIVHISDKLNDLEIVKIGSQFELLIKKLSPEPGYLCSTISKVSSILP